MNIAPYVVTSILTYCISSNFFYFSLATFQVGVEIVFKINGIPFKTFPNFEVKLQGNAALKANLGSQCVEGENIFFVFNIVKR